jgi:hypothetical protein
MGTGNISEEQAVADSKLALLSDQMYAPNMVNGKVTEPKTRGVRT